jgi:hypothetical protein
VAGGLNAGLFGVKFFVNGAWQTVLVDDLFPCVWNDSLGAWAPLFAGLAKSGLNQKVGEVWPIEIWPMVFEKAWAKLHGSYESIAGGATEDALQVGA